MEPDKRFSLYRQLPRERFRWHLNREHNLHFAGKGFAVNWLPHYVCVDGDKVLLFWTILVNAAIALAYYAIPVGLWALVRHKKVGATLGLWNLGLFGAFILSCGTGHIINIVVIFFPFYWLQNWVDTMTAILSVYTATVFAPKVLSLLGDKTERYSAHRAIETLRHEDPDWDRLFKYVERRRA